MELSVFSKEGKDTGRKVVLSDEIFGIKPNDHAIYLDVKQYMANRRQGTHKSKERGEITGSTKKLKRQKGTGGARAGSAKSPVFVGGGRAFGPRPRDYTQKLNKKVKQLARKSALSYKAKNNEIMVIEELSFEKPMTKEMVTLRNNLKIQDKKTLLVLTEENKNIYLSSRNLKNYDVIKATSLTTYNIVNASVLVFIESSFDALEKLFSN